LVALLLLEHVFLPRLTSTQRRAFDVAIVPLGLMLLAYIVANFMGAFP